MEKLTISYTVTVVYIDHSLTPSDHMYNGFKGKKKIAIDLGNLFGLDTYNFVLRR